VSSGPVVSVVIPVWNVRPYLGECLDSVLSQSIGLDRLEVIAVDDGSTDGGGELLDQYAARHAQIRVFHEPGSGGPGRPRNVGLDHATSRYVFFLDADDYLGREALERLVSTAERNSSDVVLGKMVGVGGRLPPRHAFRRSVDRAKLHQVYSTLSVLKLFRRELVEEIGLRFLEGMAANEDGLFTQRVYLSGKVFSVVADYDCYYCRLRSGSQTRGGAGPKDLVGYLSNISQRIELLSRRDPPVSAVIGSWPSTSRRCWPGSAGGGWSWRHPTGSRSSSRRRR
jgi:glycosyltransferase involved in cell wall biosynthesis